MSEAGQQLSGQSPRRDSSEADRPRGDDPARLDPDLLQRGGMTEQTTGTNAGAVESHEVRQELNQAFGTDKEMNQNRQAEDRSDPFMGQ